MGKQREFQLKIVKNSQDLRLWRKEQTDDVGFVPTMGNLHTGHMSLLEASLKEHEASVISIFVNPTQFGPNDDFAKYPRTLEADVAKCAELLKKYPNKKLVIFAPSEPQEIYPAGFSTEIHVPALDGFLEGAFRPGHFTGVATVVYLLFQLVKPRVAYFGRKDYQQYRVIKRMARDLEIPVRVKGMPIIRNSEGLALSSRNQYLSKDDSQSALFLHHTLLEVARRISGESKRVEEAREWIKNLLEKDTRFQYLEIREARTLSEKIPSKGKVVVLGLLKMNQVRLLDNLEVEIV
ncbi:MAG: pantoate--beta-alanine ligase [Bacteriovoracaceae bacterium]|nr:pantoate--beta-alanine ligase [Bacteriovoracaceae bacterium]